MLLYVSLALIVLFSSYITYYTYQRRHKITCMAGMMIAMTNSMMASISLGAVLGTFVMDKDITIPTIVSVLIGMVIGFLTGRPVSIMASIDGLTAGIMGGMMGSMLGVMLQPKAIDLMIYFVDIVFVIVMVLLIAMIDDEIKSSKHETNYRKPLVANPLVLLVLLLFMGVLVFGKGTLFPSNSEQASAKAADTKVTPTTISQNQEVEVKLTEYSPNNIVIKAGKPSVINFKTEKLGCTGIVISPELGFNISLKENTNNYVNLKALNPGTYHYSCGMGMFRGTVSVIN